MIPLSKVSPGILHFFKSDSDFIESGIEFLNQADLSETDRAWVESVETRLESGEFSEDYQFDENKGLRLELTDKVDEYLPPFFYAFDDRGNLSIGVDCEMIREELPEIEFGGEEPEGFVGLCYEVSDHGNITIWDCDGAGNRTEYLAIV